MQSTLVSVIDDGRNNDSQQDRAQDRSPNPEIPRHDWHNPQADNQVTDCAVHQNQKYDLEHHKQRERLESKRIGSKEREHGSITESPVDQDAKQPATHPANRSGAFSGKTEPLTRPVWRF
jgi:hypothetical protein